MLGVQLAQCSRTLASSSSARATSLHTSAVLQAVSARTRNSQRTLKANIQRREEIERQAQQNRPHVVLGHKAGDDAKWLDSDLAKVVINEADIVATPKPSLDGETGTYQLATYFNYGIGEKEKETLFDALPRLTVRDRVHLARLADLRNANARGIAYENRRRIVAAFSEAENPTDTGRPEVQAALATFRIRNIWDHLSRCKKDIANRRSLRRLVHKRAKILRYLKTVDEDRYDRILERLGLERSAVEGELVV
ncbi:S15/NS1 RNA-binding domain-containing protein [Ganoderma leucocontextum]|nr:S15/NS1 RNA-binding domain-containing protein [Ganoderma leucocontextum]